MGRIYSMTVMYTLLSRHAVRDIMSEGNGTFVTGFLDTNRTRIQNNGIQVAVRIHLLWL